MLLVGETGDETLEDGSRVLGEEGGAGKEESRERRKRATHWLKMLIIARMVSISE